MLSRLMRLYLLRRLLTPSHRRGRRGYGYGYGRRRPRGRTGFFGPLPYYSGRTRRGSRVHVTGCCLPIPLMLVLSAVAGARALIRR